MNVTKIETDYIINTLQRLQKMVSELPYDDNEDLTGVEIPNEYIEDYYKMVGITARIRLEKEKKDTNKIDNLTKRIEELEKKLADKSD